MAGRTMRSRKDYKRFGQAVSRELDRKGLTEWDLAELVEAHTGRFVTERWLRKLFCTRCPKWVVAAIREVLGMKRQEGRHESYEC